MRCGGKTVKGTEKNRKPKNHFCVPSEVFCLNNGKDACDPRKLPFQLLRPHNQSTIIHFKWAHCVPYHHHHHGKAAATRVKIVTTLPVALLLLLFLSVLFWARSSSSSKQLKCVHVTSALIVMKMYVHMKIHLAALTTVPHWIFYLSLCLSCQSVPTLLLSSFIAGQSVLAFLSSCHLLLVLVSPATPSWIRLHLERTKKL